MAWTREDAAHLLRRAGFGGSTQQVENLYAKGRTAAVDSLLSFDAMSDRAWDDPNPLGLTSPATDKAEATLTLLYRFLSSTRPLQTRLTWFWHGHFTSAMQVAGATLMTRQVDTRRQYAAGSFKAFLFAMYKDGAMSRLLDGDPSSKERPKENFSREKMELFTNGSGRYTGRDVRAGARAFPGRKVGYPEPVVPLNVDAHDSGTHTILGRTGNFNGDDVIRILFERPETKRHICSKLYRHFVSERLNLIELEHLMAVLKQSGGNLKSVMNALLRSNSFWDARVRGTLMKSALEYVAGLLQRFAHPLNQDIIRNVAWRLPQMGQAPFDPPNPAGYANGLRLPGASVLLSRYQFAYYAIYEIDPNRVLSQMTQGTPNRALPNEFITLLAQRLGLVSLTSATRNAVYEYLGTHTITDDVKRDKALGALYLLACSPEYQVS